METPHGFFITPGNSTSFSTDPSNFHVIFLQDPQKFHILNLLRLDFFWNSYLSIYLSIYLPIYLCICQNILLRDYRDSAKNDPELGKSGVNNFGNLVELMKHKVEGGQRKLENHVQNAP